MDELTTMREQMAAMKRSLDKSTIINHELLTKVLRQRSSWLRNTVIMEIILTPLLSLIFYWTHFQVGISVWFAISFFILSGIDTAFDWKTLRIPGSLFSQLDTITLRKKLIKQKIDRKRQFLVSLPLAAIWAVCFCYEYLRHGILKYTELDPATNAILLTIAVSLCALGVIIAVVVYRRAQRTNDTLLKELKLLLG